ncbi:MAG TPA: S-adenosylmethionine:tRNA ribosyltransferase-isomerase [Chloroflexia bacterium]|nr:S-adenosylmethionine:tRNA ribosyltransferase-isomerase [Chloroflexia bacterium]
MLSSYPEIENCGACNSSFSLRPLTGEAFPLGRALDYNLPPELEASEPPEARGLARDEVRLMVSYLSNNKVTHTRFRQLESYLQPGDVLVINTSGTLNAAIPAARPDGMQLELHLSTHLPADLWIVEVRLPDGTATKPFSQAIAGEVLQLPGEASATLLAPYQNDRSRTAGSPVRLWIATLRLPLPLEEYLDRYGFPIRYGYVKTGWPSSYYQTVYATEKGSAEMPSAGRAFTPELLTRLVARGIQVVPLILHTGVASLESHEPPYEEFYRVPAETARTINAAHQAGKRVVAVGTTVIRALETVTDENGVVHPGEGWTRLVITPERTIRAVNGLLTGLHEPRATHLAMLEALTGLAHLQVTYAEALDKRYLWHEFGDLHLILP